MTEHLEISKNALQATWDIDRQEAQATVSRGNHLKTMGHPSEGHIWLLPEETLFLLEQGALLCTITSTLLSLQQAYPMMLAKNEEEAKRSGKLTVDEFLVYGYLKRLGYIVRRCEASLKPRREVDVESGSWIWPFDGLVKGAVGVVETLNRGNWKRQRTTKDTTHYPLHSPRRLDKYVHGRTNRPTNPRPNTADKSSAAANKQTRYPATPIRRL